jgi:nitrate reductase gamma subunit
MGNNSFFVVWPYVGLAMLVAGTLLRYLLALRQPAVLAADLADAKSFFWGKLWWSTVFALLAGHLAGLLFPQAILSWNTSPVRLYLLEGLTFAAGLGALISGAALVWRHLGKPTGSLLTELFDSVFLALLLVILVSGLLVAALYRWGSSWGVITLAPYAMSLLRGQPLPDLAAQMPFLVRLHVLATFSALAIVPLTRLATFPVVALHSCLVLLGRPVRAGGNAINTWLSKRNLNAWFWPEED